MAKLPTLPEGYYWKLAVARDGDIDLELRFAPSAEHLPHETVLSHSVFRINDQLFFGGTKPLDEGQIENLALGAAGWMMQEFNVIQQARSQAIAAMQHIMP